VTATRSDDPIDGTPMLVWVLVPVMETSDPTLDYYNDYTQSYAEFDRAFRELGVEWRWQPVTSDNYRTVIDGIALESLLHYPVVFNLCDGDEINGMPGISVIRYLEETGLSYTGADEGFYQVTTSKIDMKTAFDRAGVATSPWEVVSPKARSFARVIDRLGAPLIVKPAVSAGSMGISCKSVVSSAAELKEQVGILQKGYHGWDLASGGVFVERYISGREFTALVTGSHDDPSQGRVYPAIERVFHAALPPTEQFLSFDRLWEVYEQESSLPDGEFLWEYRRAPESLQTRICELVWDAYASVGGRGYGRVDLRMDADTGELYVLEVNAQCGLSEDENYTSIGAILRFADRSFRAMVHDIIEDALSLRALARSA
jgi:D-alanine-D-alanine ligase